ncbi:hypothetical protein N9H39_10825 [Gammaproteobacteria bacterium]|nr:hypothetical protein [Gammaproteobacteria bacterium]
MNAVLEKYDRVFLIENTDPTSGICLNMTFALNGAKLCEQKNWLPVVKYDESTNPFYDPGMGDNVWDYYFEPISHFTYADIQDFLESGKLSKHKVLRVSDFVPDGRERMYQFDMHFCRGLFTDFDGIATFPIGVKNLTRETYIDLMQSKRHIGRDMVAKYIKVKPHIHDEVSAFIEREFKGHYVYGVHIRGTDFSYATPVFPEKYFELLDPAIEDNDRVKIFLATDQEQYRELFEKRYPGITVSYDCQRSNDSTAPHLLEAGGKYMRGEEALIDCLLLSNCSFLLKCASAIGEYAIYFNPQLEFVDFAMECRYTAGKARQTAHSRWSHYLDRQQKSRLRLYLSDVKGNVQRMTRQFARHWNN